jgi:hypothetical protein
MIKKAALSVQRILAPLPLVGNLLGLLSMPIQINICCHNQLAADGSCSKWDPSETRVPGWMALEHNAFGAPASADHHQLA